MRVTSPAFSDVQTIPKKHTEDGENVSPPLRIEDRPDGAVELALICEDPDAPREDPWVHWLLYRLPAATDEIPEGVPREDAVSQLGGAAQGRNSFAKSNIGYRGPAPPPGHGVHHYHFRLYALRAPLELSAGVEKDALLAAMEGKVIEEAELVGLYER